MVRQMKGGKPRHAEHDSPAGAGTELEQFLPSGTGLIELALQAGFVAPVLLGQAEANGEGWPRRVQGQPAAFRPGAVE